MNIKCTRKIIILWQWFRKKTVVNDK